MRISDWSSDVCSSDLVPSLDFVAVPPQPAFFEQVNYYRTCLHELTHATGHAKRLNRDLTNSFGSKDYAREELIAEMGSAFLCAALGIMPTISPLGWECCARTIARSEEQTSELQSLLRISYDGFCLKK